MEHEGFFLIKNHIRRLTFEALLNHILDTQSAHGQLTDRIEIMTTTPILVLAYNSTGILDWVPIKSLSRSWAKDNAYYTMLFLSDGNAIPICPGTSVGTFRGKGLVPLSMHEIGLGDRIAYARRGRTLFEEAPTIPIRNYVKCKSHSTDDIRIELSLSFVADDETFGAICGAYLRGTMDNILANQGDSIRLAVSEHERQMVFKNWFYQYSPLMCEVDLGDSCVYITSLVMAHFMKSLFRSGRLPLVFFECPRLFQRGLISGFLDGKECFDFEVSSHHRLIQDLQIIGILCSIAVHKSSTGIYLGKFEADMIPHIGTDEWDVLELTPRSQMHELAQKVLSKEDEDLLLSFENQDVEFREVTKKISVPANYTHMGIYTFAFTTPYEEPHWIFTTKGPPVYSRGNHE